MAFYKKHNSEAAIVAGLLSVMGGNSEAARRARANVQRRDRRGRFAEMGGGFSFVVKGLDGAFQGISGKVVGSSGETDVEIEVSGNDAGLPPGIYVVDSTKGTAVRAILSDEAFEDAPEVDLDSASRTHEGSFIDANDVTLIDVPSGWVEVKPGPGELPPLPGQKVFKSDDGYFLRQNHSGAPSPLSPVSTKKFTLHRTDLYSDKDDYRGWVGGALVGSGDTWAEIQTLVNGDSEDYQKEIEKAKEFKENPAASLPKIKPVSAAPLSILEKITKAADANSAVTQAHIDSFQKALTGFFSMAGNMPDKTLVKETQPEKDFKDAFDGVIILDKNGKQIRIEANVSASDKKSLSAPTNQKGTITLRADLIDVETGDVVGDISRSFTVYDDGKITVNNNSFHVDEEHQNRGIASALNARNEVLYSHGGISSVEAQGMSSRADSPDKRNYIGGTFWACAGFDWATEEDRQSMLMGVWDAVMAWRDGKKTDMHGNPLFDSDSQMEDVSDLLIRAMKESFDDENRVTAGELVRWPGADAWFADHGYADGDVSEQTLINYEKSITPAEGSTFKLEKAPEPEAEPEAAPEIEAPEPEAKAAPEAKPVSLADKVLEELGNRPRYSDIDEWKKVGEQAGSNPGGVYEDTDGVKYYVKIPKSNSHARNEVLASALYKAAGVDAVEVFIGTDVNSLRTASPIVETDGTNLRSQLHVGNQEYLDQIREGIAVDAWLSNWDTVGLTFDNIITDSNGRPVRVDPGGALMYRAQGEPKGAAFSDKVTEIDSLRDSSINPQAAQIFKDVTDEQIVSGVKRIAAISPAQISAIVDKVGGDPEDIAKLKKTLINRRLDLMNRYGVEDPHASPTPKKDDRQRKSAVRLYVEPDDTAGSEQLYSYNPEVISDQKQYDFSIDDENGIAKTATGYRSYLDNLYSPDDPALSDPVVLAREASYRALTNPIGETIAGTLTLLLTDRVEEASIFLKSTMNELDKATKDLPSEGLTEKAENLLKRKKRLEKFYNELLEEGRIDKDSIGAIDGAGDYAIALFNEAMALEEDLLASFKEVFGASVEDNIKKLRVTPRAVAVAVGVAPFRDTAPLAWDQSDFENVPSVSEAMATVAKTNRSKEDSLVDGADIEDGRVTFSKIMTRLKSYFDPNDPDAKKQLVASFKLTNWAGDRMRQTLTSPGYDRGPHWKKYDGIGFDARQLGPGGFQYYGVMANGEKHRNDAKLSAGRGERWEYADPDGRFTVIVRLSDMTYDERGTFKTANNTVEIQFNSLEPSEQDVDDAMKIAGVRDPRPARRQDMRIVAENRLLSIFGGRYASQLSSQFGKPIPKHYSDPSFNAAGDLRSETLERIKSEFGITADDMEINVGANGLIEMLLPESVAQDLMALTGVDMFSHTFSTGLAVTPDEVSDVILDVLIGAEDGSTVAGLQSTFERFSTGQQKFTGMSSETDMNTGGADYVYLSPRKEEDWPANNPHESGWGSHSTIAATLDAKSLFRRSEIWANRYDNFGRRAHDDIIGSLLPDSYEYMVKRHVGPEYISRMYVTKEVREQLLLKLEKFGITTMYGIPIEDFFVPGLSESGL